MLSASSRLYYRHGAISFSISLLLGTMGLVIFSQLTGNCFSQNSEAHPGYPILTWKNWAGIFVGVLKMIPGAFILLYFSVTRLGLACGFSTNETEFWKALLMLNAVATTALAAMIVSLVRFLKLWSWYHPGFGPLSSQVDPLEVLVGGAVFIASGGVLLVAALLMYRSVQLSVDRAIIPRAGILPRGEISSGLKFWVLLCVGIPVTPLLYVMWFAKFVLRRMSGGEEMEKVGRTDQDRRIWSVLIWIGVALFGLVCCSIFSNIWNFSAGSYFPFDSPYSLVHWHVGTAFYVKMYQDVVVVHSVYIVGGLIIALWAGRGFSSFRSGQKSASAGNTSIGDLSAVRRATEAEKRQRGGDNRSGNDGLSMSLTARQSPKSVRWIFGKPLSILFPHGLRPSVAVMLFVGLAMFFYYLWYWRWGYDRIVNESMNPDDGEKYPFYQVWARIFGHLASFLTGMTFLIIPRWHPIDRLAGTSFERRATFHRWTGLLTYVFVTLHMMIWWVKWAKEGTLWNNIWTISNLQITPTWIHYDNFTIIICEIAWLALTVMIVLALTVRRLSYRLFYAAHQFSTIFLLVGILHAWNFWYIIFVPAILWGVDRLLVRPMRSGTAQTICTSIYVVDEVFVCLELAYSRLGFIASLTERQAFGPGQFVYINIPQVDYREWHPFSVASAPHENRLKLYVKASNVPTTWTYKLRDWVLKTQSANSGQVLNESGLLNIRQNAIDINRTEDDTFDSMNTTAVTTAEDSEHLPLSASGPAHGYGTAGVSRSRSTRGVSNVGIGVDGPYGSLRYLAQRTKSTRSLLLVAGGIGITPIRALMSDVLHRIQQGEPNDPVPLNVECITLVWVVRRRGIIAPMLRGLWKHVMEVQEVFGLKVDVQIYLTGRESNNQPPPNESVDELARYAVEFGRPSLSALFADHAVHFSGSQTHMMVCGPEPMVRDCSKYAGRHGFDFHAETFAL